MVEVRNDGALAVDEGSDCIHCQHVDFESNVMTSIVAVYNSA